MNADLVVVVAGIGFLLYHGLWMVALAAADGRGRTSLLVNLMPWIGLLLVVGGVVDALF